MTNTGVAKPTTLKAPELVEMLEAGVHFGHDRAKRNPKMQPFIFTQRNRIAIFDLEKTRAALLEALAFIQTVAADPTKTILFVGTKRQAREIVRRHAETTGQPYVTKRWLGGTLTNFSTIQKSIEKLEHLKSEEANEKIQATLTKKEKAVRRKEIARLEEILEGIRSLRSLPAALIVAGVHDEELAVEEATRMGIPVVGIADTNANPDRVAHPVPGNDDAVRSLELLIGTFAQAITAARKS